MMEATSDINQLTALVNINLDRVDCQQELLEYYRWCRKNIRRGVQEEIKTNLGLNLRKKLDKLKFAQEVARRELEKLSGELMLIPSHLIEKVKELIKKDEKPLLEEPLQNQVRLSVIKEIIDLEEKILDLEQPEGDGWLRDDCDELEENQQEIPEELQEIYHLWKRQTELVEPILRTLEEFDYTFVNAEKLYSGELLEGKVSCDLLESLYNFGLIYNDLPTKPASVQVFRAWTQTLDLKNGDDVYFIHNALLGERWDIIAALLEGRTEPVKPNRYWEDYFKEQIEKDQVKIDQTLFNNIEFIGDEYRDGLYMIEEEYNYLGLLCDLVSLIKGEPEVISFINRKDNYNPFKDGDREYQAVYNNFSNKWQVISKVKDWIKLAKQKLGLFHFEALLDALFSWSLKKLERYVNRRYLELLEEQSNKRYQTYNFNFNFNQGSKNSLKEYFQVLGLTINATVDEVKKQYRKLARQFHPDLGGNEDDMKKINQAYEAIISNI